MSESSGKASSNDEKVMTVRSAVNLDIVSDNIQDIANFAIEKHEYRNATSLSAEQREAASAKAREALWAFVEELKVRRQKALQTMFVLADKAVEEAVGEK